MRVIVHAGCGLQHAAATVVPSFLELPPLVIDGFRRIAHLRVEGDVRGVGDVPDGRVDGQAAGEADHDVEGLVLLFFWGWVGVVAEEE